MANINGPYGLKPVRHKSGAPWNGAANPYYIPSGYGTALFIGDPVVITGTSNTAIVEAPGIGKKGIGTMPEINKATAGDGNAVSGVIVGFAALPTNLNVNYHPASTEGVALVCDDPDVIFSIQADGAVPAASMGLNAVFIYSTAGSTATGKSGVQLDTTSDVPAADASNQMTIWGAVDAPDNDTTASYARVLVTLNNHTNAQGRTANGDGSLGT